MARIPPFEIELVRSEPLSPRVRTLVFRRVDGTPLEFEAGQWLSLLLPTAEGEIRRAYSIASPPRGTPEFELAVTLVAEGPGSRFLHGLRGGDRLTAIGPQGFFTRDKGRGKPTIHVATGTGVTPLRSMVLDAVSRGDTAPQWLLFGSRSKSDLLYREQFESLAKTHTWFRYVPTLSQPTDAWTGLAGYVQVHIPHLWKEMEALGHGSPHTFICGLHEMVNTSRDLLRKEMNVPRELVHSERYD